jgi:lipopolysaccharide/colanic/teichoic acid biosynthesis glycosyltransferase
MNKPEIISGIPRWVEAPVAFLALCLAAPLLMLLGTVIALTSPGPIIFRQKRVGLYGRLFTLYKLRTMHLSTAGPQVTASDDGRTTSVGRFLRKTKLDELPELWNVFKGDMSIVGPRPEVPRYVDVSIVTWQEVLRARPGITDPVTLKLRNEEVLLASVKGDRERYYLEKLQPYKLQGYKDYFENRGFWSDICVLWKTLVAVILPDTSPPPTLAEIAISPSKRIAT